MKLFFGLILLIFTSKFVFAQSDILNQERHLIKLYNEIKNQETFDDKITANEKFLGEFKKTMSNKESFKFPFDSLKNVKGLKEIKSSDNKIQVFTWGIKNNYEGIYQYFGLIIKRESSKNSVFELKDNLDPTNSRITGIVDISNWYGALYIDIITKNIGSKKYYTLFGWDGNSYSSNIRILDVLTFSGKTVKLGAPIFKNQKEKLNRVYFEYAESAAMNMTYEEKYKRIMFDHLIPETPDLKGIYSFYIPDFSYDSYVWKKDGWHLMEDVIGINDKREDKITVITSSKKGGIKKQKIKNKWINPNDESGTQNEFVHVARTPESEMQVELPEKKSKQKKFKKTKKSDPLLPQSIYGKKKKKKRKKRY
ncbi:MAG: hypothetical protein ACKO7D_07815 [Bacteroidota bacterium]